MLKPCAYFAAEGGGSGQEKLMQEQEAVDRQVREVTAKSSLALVAKNMERKKKSAGQVSHLPPGIKVFSNNPHIFYTHRDLDLVRDFKYRLRHEDRGFKTEEHLKKVSLRDQDCKP